MEMRGMGCSKEEIDERFVLGILSISRLTDDPTSIRDSPSNGLEMSNDLVQRMSSRV